MSNLTFVHGFLLGGALGLFFGFCVGTIRYAQAELRRLDRKP